ncbi:heparan-alpha-glucosaminide N-acetyltransferase [Rhizobium sp. LjRoot258]|uniref:heparan-alpha-glucosaminide N-acetyltransferase n=1 Tax=Rhizobium sp. LjRoot258 TaxID=3342299 RepID=UPI003ECEF615
MTATATETYASVKPPRIGLLDTARGVALLAMATYHFTWDMEFMGYLAPGTAETGWLKLYARAIASTFLFIVGISLVLANKPEIRWQSFWKRFAMIAAAALAISVVTRFVFPGEWIFFGILHCIAVLSLLGLVFLRLPLPVTIAATAAVTAAWVVDTWVAPNLLRSPIFNPRYLAWIGLAEMPQRSNDYVPIFPWAAPFLLGMTATLLAMRTRLLERLAALGTGSSLPAKAGRHSLAFYLIHQPVLIAIAYGLSVVVPPAKPDPVESYLKQCNASCMMQEGEALCRSFCQCTLDKLQTENLFTEFQSGALKPDDGRIMALASECNADAQ